MTVFDALYSQQSIILLLFKYIHSVSALHREAQISIHRVIVIYRRCCSLHLTAARSHLLFKSTQLSVECSSSKSFIHHRYAGHLPPPPPPNNSNNKTNPHNNKNKNDKTTNKQTNKQQQNNNDQTFTETKRDEQEVAKSDSASSPLTGVKPVARARKLTKSVSHALSKAA